MDTSQYFFPVWFMKGRGWEAGGGGGELEGGQALA